MSRTFLFPSEVDWVSPLPLSCRLREYGSRFPFGDMFFPLFCEKNCPNRKITGRRKRQVYAYLSDFLKMEWLGFVG